MPGSGIVSQRAGVVPRSVRGEFCSEKKSDKVAKMLWSSEKLKSVKTWHPGFTTGGVNDRTCLDSSGTRHLLGVSYRNRLTKTPSPPAAYLLILNLPFLPSCPTSSFSCDILLIYIPLSFHSQHSHRIHRLHNSLHLTSHYADLCQDS